MIIVLQHGKHKNKIRITCHYDECGCIFCCDESDIAKKRDGRMYINCPECKGVLRLRELESEEVREERVYVTTYRGCRITKHRSFRIYYVQGSILKFPSKESAIEYIDNKEAIAPYEASKV